MLSEPDWLPPSVRTDSSVSDPNDSLRFSFRFLLILKNLGN